MNLNEALTTVTAESIKITLKGTARVSDLTSEMAKNSKAIKLGQKKATSLQFQSSQ